MFTKCTLLIIVMTKKPIISEQSVEKWKTSCERNKIETEFPVKNNRWIYNFPLIFRWIVATNFLVHKGNGKRGGDQDMYSNFHYITRFKSHLSRVRLEPPLRLDRELLTGVYKKTHIIFCWIYIEFSTLTQYWYRRLYQAFEQRTLDLNMGTEQ